MKTQLWTWGGRYFGYREGDDLWHHEGNHVGQFEGDEIFSADGRYLGEVRSGNRLIVNCSKKGRIGRSFSSRLSRVAVVPYVDYVGNIMVAGYEDFAETP